MIAHRTIAIFFLLPAAAPVSLSLPDLDGDGLSDIVAATTLSSLANMILKFGAAEVLVLPGIPIPQGAAFRRGDVDAGGSVDLEDVVAFLSYQFLGGK